MSSPPTIERPRTAARRALGCTCAFVRAVVPTILVFLIVGPLIGYFAIMLPIVATAMDGPLGALHGLVSTLAFLPLGGLFAYMLGYLPALVTGFAVAAMDCLVDLGEYRTPVAILVGAGITLGLLLWTSALETVPGGEVMQGGGAVSASVGGIAAGICAMIAPRRVPSFPSA